MSEGLRLRAVLTALVVAVGCAGARDGDPGDGTPAAGDGGLRRGGAGATGARARDGGASTGTGASGEGGGGGAGGVGGASNRDGGATPPTGAGGAPPAGGGGATGRADAGGASGDAGTTPPARAIPAHILPVFFLDLPGVSCDVNRPNTLGRTKVTGRMKVVEDHDGAHADKAALKARPAAFEGVVGVSRRGESSASLNFAQLSYSIETRNAAGAPISVPLLGLPSDEDWALIGCWNDKTCMRHPLAYALGRTMGDWHPRTRFAEVYCNDDYKGLYLFVEPPRRGRNRVDIAKVAADASGGVEGLSGGYIFRREGGGKKDEPPRNFTSPVRAADGRTQVVYVYHYPRETDLTAAQKEYLHGYVATFENGMKSGSIGAWIDMKSWARYALINELANNIDAFWKSVYFVKDRDVGGERAKLRISPVWDFNIAWGNANYRDGWKPDVHVAATLRAWRGECLATDVRPWLPPIPSSCGTCDQVYRRAAGGPPEAGCTNAPYLPFYWERVLAEAAFQRELRCEWRAQRRAALTMQTVDALVNEWKGQIRPNAVARHFRRWPELRGAVWPNPCAADKRVPGLPSPTCGPADLSAQAFLDHEVSYMRAWVNARMAWLDGRFTGACN